MPEIGANLIQLALAPQAGGDPVEVIAPVPDAAALVENPSRHGSPVLFPFPGRIAGGRFTYNGREHHVDVYPDGNARHGFLMDRPFTVEGFGQDAAGAWLKVSCDGNQPDIQRQWPYPFRLTMTFRLEAGGLILQLEGTNTGQEMMPLGFGWHPYFRMPILPTGTRGACRLQIPADKHWELTPDLLPTGRVLPVEGKFDMRAGRAVGDLLYDDIMTGVIRDEAGFSHASLIDPAGVKVTVSAGPTFREWVIYTPPERPAVCMEPYTCAGNALNLRAAGLDAGVIDVQPGESWSDQIRVTVSAV